MNKINRTSKSDVKELTMLVKELEERNKTLESLYVRYKNANNNIDERVKELNCMYQVAQFAVAEESADTALQKIVSIIPHGWQYPEITCARITIKNKEYLSDNFIESPWCQREVIKIDDRTLGTIEVFYKKEMAPAAEGPFLTEERNLITGVANIISFFIKRQQDDKRRKIMQQQLFHADRLATIGQLAAGVAHELNEPLGNILGFAQLSLKIPGATKQVSEDLKKIEESAMYSREIIKKLMEFSRQSPPKIETAEFSEVIDKSVFFLESRCLKEGVNLHKYYIKDIVITADPNQIKQVVTNLVLNAIQSMPRGGELTIGTRHEGDSAILYIEDTGHGIPEEKIGKIFMPFYTTKDVGQGTGLGLSVVYGIVKSHKGDIKVSSETGKGTKFEVSFPLETDL